MDRKRTSYQQKYRDRYKSQAKRVNLTLSLSEHREFSREAKTHNLKIASYVKSLALAGLNNQAIIPPHLESELKTLRFAIRNIANNVNQIAHHSNMIREISSTDENNLLQHLKQLEEAIYSYTEGQILKKDHDH